MNNEIWNEVARLVLDYDAQRPKYTKEYRLYYNVDGTVIGMWENNYPDGENYILLDDPKVFFNSNSLMLRVQNQKLILLDHCAPSKTRLKKSTQGVQVVKGQAALILEKNETYPEVEYYDRTDN